MIMGSIKKRPSGSFALLGLPICVRAIAITLLFFSWKAFVTGYSAFDIIAESLKKIKSQSTATTSNHTLRLPEKALTYQNRQKNLSTTYQSPHLIYCHYVTSRGH